MIGRLEAVVLDAADPQELARFYAQLLGWRVIRVDDDGWADIGDGAGGRLSFQHAPDHRPPRWPDPAFPQQFHLDIEVADVEAAEPQVLALGATRLPWGSDEEVAAGERPPGGGGFRVYADPAGHPFCLTWAGG